MNEFAYFDRENLTKIATSHQEVYRKAKPFPHIVFNNLFPEEVLTQALSEFPDPKDPRWMHYKGETEKKLASRDERFIGPFTRHFLYALNSAPFIEFLEQLTGIEGLIPDPHFEGGGLHQIESAGLLKIHADFNKHPRLRLDRRLNILIYLNKNWDESYGGHLELWNKEMTQCEQKILPVFNRTVIFSTTFYSYHGHPDPLTCPESMTRKSLALYYYSNGRPLGETVRTHSTLFQKRAGEGWKAHKKKWSIRPKKWIQKYFPQLFYK
ncbi:MAG: 2OG-Fe(II) oxygenase [Deltaproteobacteria bacterium]|nr:2OG-Fe(II) oxygenase [Deltaproteobacteria bacterium]